MIQSINQSIDHMMISCISVLRTFIYAAQWMYIICISSWSRLVSVECWLRGLVSIKLNLGNFFLARCAHLQGVYPFWHFQRWQLRFWQWQLLETNLWNNLSMPSCNCTVIVDVRVAYIRKLAILGDRDHLVTANYSPVLCSYLWGPLDLNPW